MSYSGFRINQTPASSRSGSMSSHSSLRRGGSSHSSLRGGGSSHSSLRGGSAHGSLRGGSSHHGHGDDFQESLIANTNCRTLFPDPSTPFGDASHLSMGSASHHSNGSVLLAPSVAEVKKIEEEIFLTALARPSKKKSSPLGEWLYDLIDSKDVEYWKAHFRDLFDPKSDGHEEAVMVCLDYREGLLQVKANAKKMKEDARTEIARLTTEIARLQYRVAAIEEATSSFCHLEG